MPVLKLYLVSFRQWNRTQVSQASFTLTTSHCPFAHMIASGVSEIVNCATPEPPGHFLSIFQNKLIFDLAERTVSPSATVPQTKCSKDQTWKYPWWKGTFQEAFIQTSTLRPNMFDNELPDPVWQQEQPLQVLSHPPKHNGALDMDHMQQCALHVPRCSLQQVTGWATGKFFTSCYDSPSPLWADSRGIEKIKRPVLPISINVSIFWSFQRGSVSQQRHCIMFLKCWWTLPRQGQLYWQWVRGSPPATATTGHLPSQRKPDTNAIYRSCCRTRQASQPLFINVQIGFLSWQAEEVWKKKSWSSVLFFERNRYLKISWKLNTEK